TSVFSHLKSLDWTIGEFLYSAFRTHDDSGNIVRRDERHGTIIGMFLSGQTKRKPIQIINYWLEDHAGRPKMTNSEFTLRYSPNADWSEIKHASVAITAMAVQLTMERMLREQKTADLLERHQPLTFHILRELATPAERRDESGKVMIRKTRPPTLVTTEVISTLNFSRTKHARLVPAARSILYFACGVPRVVFDYSSRVALTQSWSTAYETLARLGKQDAEYLVQFGRNPAQWPVIRMDNVQQYQKRRERHMGRENAMKVGVAATVVEAFDFTPEAADVDDRLRRIREDRRSDLSVDQLTNMVDFDHLDIVFTLQWMQVLVDYVPALAPYKPEVAHLYRTEGAKLRLPEGPERKARIHSLATSAKNEAVTPELLAALLDFLGQIGQSEGDYTRRLIPVGGDGLTFEKLVQLKNYLQFQDDEFQRCELIMPFLEVWHTLWTYLSLVFETHFGDALTKDVSTLGHSATKIDQKAPTNLKKVDYYPSLYTAYIVLDARMLDCWRTHLDCDDLHAHFEILSLQNTLPTMAELRQAAATLHHRYSTQKAWFSANEGGSSAAEAGWKTGSPWRQDKSNATQEARPLYQPSSGGQSHSPGPDTESSAASSERGADSESSDVFEGDTALARSILFMSETMLSRDASQAVASGDVGRLWNDLKIMMFSFAGSSHTKYATYLLEMICSLELESSPVLRDAFLRNWLVNPSGEPGRMIEGDLLQEHLNLELEEAITRKGAEWDSKFIRQVISPNVYHFVELKNQWGGGVGLAARRGRHPEPHSRPEIKTLLATYKDAELHSFCPGRSHHTWTEVKSNFEAGVVDLEQKKLKKFIGDSTRARSILQDTHTAEGHQCVLCMLSPRLVGE
ncbi:hypothetical protein BV20DRAFT_948539, partial [Pilatotrama ljubarskyi]